MKHRRLFSPKFWIIFVFVAGVIYLLALQLLVSEGTYFSGDSGLKSLLTQNVASGNWGFDIHFYEPLWVKTLWGQGLFPYYYPFVYQLLGKYFITFPYTFSLITAPFYIFWGYRGLYIIPMLATFGIWILFYLLCKKIDLGLISVGIGLLILIFATNLSLYSAIYWEHTLAVFLSLAGFYWMFPKKGSQTISIRDAVLGGVFSGLSVWFRPEQIFLVIFMSLISLGALIKISKPDLLRYLNTGKMSEYIGKSGWIYPLCSFLTLLLYGLTNWLIYHNFFGVHSIQVINQQMSLIKRILIFIGNLQLMTVGQYSLFLYAPIVLLPLIYLFLNWIKRGKVKSEQDWNIWCLFCPLFLLGVAILVPAGAGGRQWGPRLLLFLVPLMVLLFTWQLDHLLKIPIKVYGITGKIGLGVVLIAVGVGIIQNPIRGTDFLNQTYSQEKSTLTELRFEEEPVVAISNQFLAQLFQPSVSRNIIFIKAETDDELSMLCKALVAQNLHSFSYICYSFDCKLFELHQKSKQVIQNGVEYNLKMVNAREFGIYTIFDIQLFP
jgi:hypothetical protein